MDIQHPTDAQSTSRQYIGPRKRLGQVNSGESLARQNSVLPSLRLGSNNLDLHKGDMKKTWKLINELSSKNTGKTNRVSELNFNNKKITGTYGYCRSF